MKKYNVLVIDDERIIRDGISKSIDWEALNLNLQGSCEDAFDALDIFNNNPPDIAIVDIRMPGMSGLELIETVRKEGIPIQFIILSGYGEFELAQKAISFGVRQYLLKPINPEKLKQSLMDISKELATHSDTSKWTLHRSLKQTLSGIDKNSDTLKKYLFTEEDLFWV
ncbi:MAG: response regulator, partial [Spirochaetales bacterium]|nr:response regulator [Spirochaetales bacterium]